MLGFLWMMSLSSSRPAGRLVVRPTGHQALRWLAQRVLLFTFRGNGREQGRRTCKIEGVDCSHGVRGMLKPAGLLYRLL
jgi:hypothetical protein